jgi:hypothetical protein
MLQLKKATASEKLLGKSVAETACTKVACTSISHAEYVT